jgi:hypothetical protein
VVVVPTNQNNDDDGTTSTTNQKQCSSINLHEMKLVLALEWQRGRWDGTDGGPNGYAVVLHNMATAQRYEDTKNNHGWHYLVNDMIDRFPTISSNETALQDMQSCRQDVTSASSSTKEAAQRAFCRCAGLVLREMGFIERGL